ncbi:hypothetical protein GGH95_001914, partial [Coemansia sp. RSA 1836]
MVTIARAVSSVGFAAVAVWLLCQATGYASLLLDDEHQRKIICGKKWRWEWSLESDCFRVGLVWPVVLWLAVIVSSAALAVYCLLPGSFTSNGFCGTGSREKPVRRPLGPVIMRDNRTRVGSAVVALSIVQAAVLLYAWQYEAGTISLAHVYTSLVAQLAVLIAVANAIFFAIYLFSDRMLYAGLFPWPLPTLVLVHLLIGSCEVYYSFFTPATRNVPIFGRKASLYANTVVVSTLVSAITLLTYARAQLRPVFVRPLLPGSAADPQYLEYSPASDVEANENDDGATPLARRADQKPMPLVETSELNVSWYSTLVFSWTNDILRRGTVRPLEATDLCYLDESDMPIPSWRRYLRHRKPGRSLLVTMLITFAPELVLQAVLALATSVLQFSSPFFLQRILRSIELLGGKSDGIGHGILTEKSIRGAYLDAFGLLFFTLAASTISNQPMWVGRHIGMRIKGILVAELSSKTLRRSGKGSWSDIAANGEGEGNRNAAPAAQAAADGKIMNLVTADFLRVVESFAYPYKALSLPLTLLLGIWYMYLLLGVSALVGLSIAVLYMPLSKSLLFYVASVEEKLASLSDERVTVITELLQGIKAVKLFGWESRFLEMVDERRERQLKYMWKNMVSWVAVATCSALAPMLILVAIFTVYVVGFGNKLTAEIAFTTISVFQLVRVVFVHLPEFSNWIIGGYVALGRIDSYLGQPQVQDLEKRVAHISSATSGVEELGFESANLEWESPSSNAKPDGKILAIAETPDTSEQTPLLADTAAATPHTQIGLSSVSESYASLDRDDGSNKRNITSSSGYDDDLVRFALKDIDARFPHGALSIVAGPTGSGKSSLLSALIGEMTLTRGRILLPTVDSRLATGGDY